LLPILLRSPTGGMTPETTISQYQREQLRNWYRQALALHPVGC